jgi:hypothetical protein
MPSNIMCEFSLGKRNAHPVVSFFYYYFYVLHLDVQEHWTHFLGFMRHEYFHLKERN